MAVRLDAVDAAFLRAEDSGRLQHTGSLAICDDPARLVDHAAITRLVRRLLAAVPRYRQVVRTVPGRLAPPVWTDDPEFDLSYHVRRSPLPRPGGQQQLYELVTRILSEPLNRSRPLWELHLVEGLAENRVALVTKSHHALVDGVTTVDIGQLVLDAGADEPLAPGSGDEWRASPAPSSLGLVAGAVLDVARRPSHVVNAVRVGVTDARSVPGRVAAAASSVASAARTAALPTPRPSPPYPVGSQRQFTTVDTSLADYRAVRTKHGGSITDVVLTTVTGALRAWLESRGTPVAPGATIRAVVPVSVRAGGAPAGSDAGPNAVGAVSTYLVDLPVGEPNPVVRLHLVGLATQAHRDTGRAVPAGSLVRSAGFAAPTLHALGARAASTLAERSSHLVVSNVPGPQAPRHILGARLLRSYPVPPLPPGQALGIGVTSYDGGVCYGLYADRRTIGDTGVMAQCVTDALRELVVASR